MNVLPLIYSTTQTNFQTCWIKEARLKKSTIPFTQNPRKRKLTYVTERRLLGEADAENGREGISKEHTEKIGGGGKYFHYLDCGDGFTGVCLCQNPPNGAL